MRDPAFNAWLFLALFMGSPIALALIVGMYL